MTSKPNSSTLSPREKFQDSVRQLSSEELHRHRRNKSISLKYNPYELQHVSSLRVSPRRRSPYRAGPTSLRQVTEEADFGTEERDIWSRRSPIGKSGQNEVSAFVLHEDSNESPTQYKSQTDRPPLSRPQIIISCESDDRPKTRRGPAGPSAFETIGGCNGKSEEQDNTSPERTTKFTEGTMSSRSAAVASTWSDSEYATSSSEAEETDSDATPKASRKRRSSSIDLRDFQPPTTAPSAIRRTLFGRRDINKSKKLEPSTKPKQLEEDQVKKPKKRLRKSMSKLHSLGEKMKIFGSSSQDLHEQNKHDTYADEQEKSILEDRKRKAEAAYAEQFGHKKQRDNDGSANITSSPEPVESHIMPGNQKYDSSTVRHRGSTARSRRTSTGSIVTDGSLSRQGSVNEHDIRKRPSRRELEKENQQLRALLRESQTVKDFATTYTSESDAIPPVPPLRIRRVSAATSDSQPPTDAKFIVSQDTADPAPPVPPQHPDRRVLSNVSNSRSRRTRRESFGIVSDSDFQKPDGGSSRSNPLQNTPILPPPFQEKKTSMAPRRSMPAMSRSVSMIVEEPENEIDEKKRSLRSRTAAAAGKENKTVVARVDAKSKGPEWQWPDDVF